MFIFILASFPGLTNPMISILKFNNYYKFYVNNNWQIVVRDMVIIHCG